MHDALAAKLVLHAFARGGTLVLAPLDVTDSAIVSPQAVSQMARAPTCSNHTNLRPPA